MKRDSLANTFIVALGLCLVCAAIVSLAAVGLRAKQVTNKLKDRKANILKVCGLYKDDQSVDEIYDERIEDKIIELESGADITEQVAQEFGGAGKFDAERTAKPEFDAHDIEASKDEAQLGIRETRAHVYVVKASASDPTPVMYIIPIRGKGLWSILKGFIAIDADLQSVRGLTFYEHAETPGLGGNVDVQEWKDKWPDRKIYDDKGEIAIHLPKIVQPGDLHGVDALAGATITSNGVENMIRYWLGPDAYGPFLDRIRAAQSNDTASLADLAPARGGI